MPPTYQEDLSKVRPLVPHLVDFARAGDACQARMSARYLLDQLRHLSCTTIDAISIISPFLNGLYVSRSHDFNMSIYSAFVVLDIILSASCDYALQCSNKSGTHNGNDFIPKIHRTAVTGIVHPDI